MAPTLRTWCASKVKNLGNVVSVKFNDVEVDPKEIYARYDMLLAPVPRQLPAR